MVAVALEPRLRRWIQAEIARSNAEPKWLTTAQAGIRIGIGASAVRERIKHGQLQGTKWMGRWYVASADIDREIDAAAASATVTPYPQSNGPSGALTPPALIRR